MNKRRYYRLLALLLIGVLAGVAAAVLSERRPTAQRLDTDAADSALLSAAVSELADCKQPGFAKVEPGTPLRLPQDHAAHPSFCSEAWYLHGTLSGVDAPEQAYGFQLTLLRLALTPEPLAVDSDWASRQIYSAQLMISDPAAEQRYFATRVSRGALGLAGATAASGSARVWLENWSLDFNADNQVALNVSDAASNIALRLTLNAGKPAVTGIAPTTAALRTYALTRLDASGQLILNKRVIDVAGSAWLDRGWGTLPLGQGGSGAGQVAFNRFSLRLNDNRELALIQQRRRDGSGTPIVTGYLIDAAGKTRRLRRRELTLTELDRQTNRDNGQLPTRWRLQMPDYAIDITVAPLLAAALAATPPLWGGAVALSGSHSGSGWVELSGYAPSQ